MSSLFCEDNSPAMSDEGLKAQIVTALKTVYDPEIPVNICDLGLIYAIDMDAQRNVTIDMTLTAPACPVAGTLPKQVQKAVENVQGVERVTVQLVWDPPWNRKLMSDEAKLTLGLM